MPMYQYACISCGQSFEKKLSMSQASDTQECPHCSSKETRKKLGAVALGAGATPTRNVAPPLRTSPFS